MSRFVLRCNRCRTRNTFKKPVTNWTQPRYGEKLSVKSVNAILRKIGGKRCRDCGHTSFYIDKERVNRKPCRCEGAYHWGPHRKGSPYCIHHPKVDTFRAYREGLDDDDLAWFGIGATKHQPGAAAPF